MLCYLPPTTPEEKEKLGRSLELLRRYGELKFSEAMFAGAILQAAYIAIRLYSPSKSVPASCVDFSLPASAASFCIGKLRHDVPIGLVVYAGRNQYAHWDDKEPLKATRAIFATLDASFQNKPLCDLAFDLKNLTTNIYSAEVLHLALGWTSYETYLAEMKGAVGK
jgi:hypothetical protein